MTNSLFQAVQDTRPDVVRSASLLLKKADGYHPQILNVLWRNQTKLYQEDIAESIAAIQKRCGFYNYEIAQAARARELAETSTKITQKLYEKVLTTIHNSGGNIESSPKKIRNLDEESLRYILINAINAKYGNVAEAEAYNKDGKTDILVRIDGKKILIAECKIWHGEEGLEKALDQLIQRYVTWRDTNLALLLFSRNKGFTAVRQKIPQELEQYSNFVRDESIDLEIEKAWFRFVICHPDDCDRELTLTILAFNIPS